MKMEIPAAVADILEKLQANGFEAYAVGGCVRDALLGREPEDWDITTSALPQEVKKIFRRTIDTGIEHGTVTVMIDKTGYEVTTYRIDGDYEDSRHPKDITFTASLKEDLKRRDFTINAMAYNPQEGLVDIFGGQEDLEKGIIRCVGSARERFDEDALRILRAVRFAGQLGFEIEEETKQAIPEKAAALTRISAERIRVELDKLLVSSHPEKLLVASETDILKYVLPEYDVMLRTPQNNPHHIYSVGKHCMKALQCVNEYCLANEIDRKQRSVLSWVMLLHDAGKPEMKTTDFAGIDHFKGHAEVSAKLAHNILRRLKFDNQTISLVTRLIKWHDYRFTPEEKHMRRAANRIGVDIMDLLFIVETMDVRAQNPETWEAKLSIIQKAEEIYQEILKKQQCLNLKDLAVNGGDLMREGYQAGPKLGEILNYLLECVLENPEQNQKETLLRLTKEKFQ
ncbi:MAG: CCA tRNA nucleotidyltransferase [Lachnospiraceae bacterium]|nr:CCA tRNA nucleotidyltransferase [Lachnospiraceae bacterium]